RHAARLGWGHFLRSPLGRRGALFLPSPPLRGRGVGGEGVALLGLPARPKSGNSLPLGDHRNHPPPENTDVNRLPLILLVLLSCFPAARADLHFPQPSAAAGEVRSGMALSQRFAFVNRGPEAVTITTLRASCGCLRPRLECGAAVELPHVVQPGETGVVVLEVSTLSQATGSHTWTVTVGSQSGGQAGETTLTLSGNVVSEGSGQPASLTGRTRGTAAH